MDITPLVPKGKPLLTGYGEGGFKINQEFVPGSLIVLPESFQPWGVANPGQISIASLAPVLEAQGVELLLLGTGTSIAFVDPDIRKSLRAKGIGLDVMDTGAACRTFNVLAGEGRLVAAALVAV